MFAGTEWGRFAMTDSSTLEASPRPDIAELDRSDLAYALRMGWKDFRRAPGFGLVFSAVYVLGGLFLMFISGGFVTQTLILALGFHPNSSPFSLLPIKTKDAPSTMPEEFPAVWT